MKNQFLSSASAVLILSLLTSNAMANECSVTVESNDAMQFNLKSMVVPKTCSKFSITLTHTGKMPKSAMGHNLVVSKTSDMAAISKDGIGAGVANDYLKPQDSRVLAHTKLIGGGESTTIELVVAQLKAGESYSYFCSFPGHVSLMKGSVNLGS
ncbi:azurin [Comamonas aquatica]|uniref:Azurin n=1 Tax=Comamonas aquatica TaxID=225991 RepID=A0AA42W2L0_9BURK|nr:azurin [Comamonas aquatica]MDH1429715.1 azurin [Comamonas aquatica]MDH1605315.1 azurin [Comamonas aquatica]MDH1616936.1 azurin [Comamonas aquatica]MDH2005358.1 azurin [Comamonas aquatica]